MEFKEKTVLFRTIVGSHMWNQQHEKSDKDMFECYIVDTRSILLGNRHDKGKHTKRDNEETTSHEIGKVIKELLKGNINFLWGVTSNKFDFVNTNIDPNMWDLRKIVRENLSKSTVHSIRGFAIHNLKHWFGIELDVVHSVGQFRKGYIIVEKSLPRLTPKDKKYWKILNTCARTLDFGIRLLRHNGDGFYCYFDNPRSAKSPGDILLLLGELEEAYRESSLPEKPDPKPFEDFLIDIRKRELLFNIIFHILEEDNMSIDSFCSLLKRIKDTRDWDFAEL